MYGNGLIYSSVYSLSSLAGRLSHPGLLLVSDDTAVIISHSVITGNDNGNDNEISLFRHK